MTQPVSSVDLVVCPLLYITCDKIYWDRFGGRKLVADRQELVRQIG